MSEAADKRGMTAWQARTLEWLIILLCLAALAMIFQPFSLDLFTAGCIAVVVGGLIFNLIPFCRQGVTLRFLLKVVLIVIVILLVAGLLGIGTANLYALYLQSLR